MKEQGRKCLGQHEEWLSILKLSNLWGISELRKRSIDELSKKNLDSMSKIAYADNYKVERWLVEGYTELVERDESLSDEDREILGHMIAFHIYEIRENTFRYGIERGNAMYTRDVSAARNFSSIDRELRQRLKGEIESAMYNGDGIT